MNERQPLKNRRNGDPNLDRRSGEDRRTVHDLDFFDQGGIERRSGAESRKKGGRRLQGANVSKSSSVGLKTKSPAE